MSLDSVETAGTVAAAAAAAATAATADDVHRYRHHHRHHHHHHHHHRHHGKRYDKRPPSPPSRQTPFETLQRSAAGHAYRHPVKVRPNRSVPSRYSRLFWTLYVFGYFLDVDRFSFFSSPHPKLLAGEIFRVRLFRVLHGRYCCARRQRRSEKKNRTRGYRIIIFQSRSNRSSASRISQYPQS